MTTDQNQLTLPGVEVGRITLTWPQHGTLAERALDAMAQGSLLDHEAFLRSSGSWRLAAVVCSLRALGWPIETLNTEHYTSDGELRRIAKYKLKGECLALSLANGQQEAQA